MEHKSIPILGKEGPVREPFSTTGYVHTEVIQPRALICTWCIETPSVDEVELKGQLTIAAKDMGGGKMSAGRRGEGAHGRT